MPLLQQTLKTKVGFFKIMTFCSFGYNSLSVLGLSQNVSEMFSYSTEMASDDLGNMHLIDEADIIVDFHTLMRQIYENEVKENEKEYFDGKLTKDGICKRDEFITKNHISPISQLVAELLIHLEWYNNKKTPPMPLSTIYGLLLYLEEVVNRKQTWEVVGENIDIDGPLDALLQYEVIVITDNFSMFINETLCSDSKEALFFPLPLEPSKSTIEKWRILGKIAQLKLIPLNIKYNNDLPILLQKRIQDEVKLYISQTFQDHNLENPYCAKDNVLTLAELVEKLNKILLLSDSYTRLNEVLLYPTKCSWWNVVTETLDNELFNYCEKIVKAMDAYNEINKHFLINIKESCATCHKLYIELKKLITLLTESVTDQVLCKKLQSFSILFREVFQHILNTLQDDCLFRITRGIELEGTNFTGKEKPILDSSVIMLTSLCKVIEEWKKLEIVDEDIQIAYIYKIPSIILNSFIKYTDYIDKEVTNPDHVNDETYIKKVGTLINTIKYIKDYFEKFPDSLKWKECINCLKEQKIPIENQEEALRGFDRVIESMTVFLSELKERVLNNFAKWICQKCNKNLICWMQDYENGGEQCGQLIDLLHEYLEKIHEVTEESMMPCLLASLWKFLLYDIRNNIQEGRPEQYAKEVKRGLEQLLEYFQHFEMEECTENTTLLESISSVLKLNSKTTIDLQLEYYNYLADISLNFPASPTESYGHISFRAGYRKKSDETIDVIVKVENCQQLPLKNHSIKELKVKVALCPSSLFPGTSPVKAKTSINKQNNPVFNQEFHFSQIPSDVLTTEGCVLSFVVINQNASFHKEVAVRLNTLQDISNLLSIQFAPVLVWPLQSVIKHCSFCEILEKRSSWDESAKASIMERHKMLRTKRSISDSIDSFAKSIGDMSFR